MMPNNNTVLEGIISVKAAIKAKKRTFYNVYIDEKKVKQRDRKIIAFTSFLKSENIEYTLLPREEIDEFVKTHTLDNAGKTHGGVVAECSEIEYMTLDSILERDEDFRYYVFLDGVEDPFNLGYSVRILYAMGCAGIIISDRNWSKAQGVIARASAGASELCDIAVCKESDNEIADAIKNHGLDIICSALSKDSVPVGSFVPEKPFVLFIGGEKRGISNAFMENAKTTVHIPYARNVRYSLPTASVCAVYADRLSEYVKKAEGVCSDT